MSNNTLRSLLVCGSILFAAQVARAGEDDCGSLRNAYGPFDYTNLDHRQNKIPIVEGAHFQPQVEALQLGGAQYHTNKDLIENLDYTLRAIPNHHRALATVARFQLRGWKTEPYRTADCYFDRAIRFKSEDGYVYLLFATYLHRKKDFQGALAQYEAAGKLLQDSDEVAYNMGLLYLDMKEPQRAKEAAIRVYSHGYPLQGLRDRLKRAKAWSAEDDATVAQALRQGSTD
jgi:tetratricopeptide (TPR) repeat protein